ncbi:hypothetical protein [Nannocystis sp.]|uniref:hypothetical protein n=1 Tax=Nannocystis sp. TaxID=1962667 RepID=UPI0025D46ED4|nr:hypothetical protein [Nannocystis sp.]MBK7827802.1 hypothetical protein [Nannocystis sp.]
MSDPRQDTPFGARLLALALASSALFGLVVLWARQRAIRGFALLEIPDDQRESLFAALDAAAHAELGGELLLVSFVLVGASRLGRATADRLTHHLSLGAGVLLALDAARAAAFALMFAWGDPNMAPADRQASAQLFLLGGLALRLGGFGLLIAALLRGERGQGARRPRVPIWSLVATLALLAYPLAWMTDLPAFAQGTPPPFTIRDALPLILGAGTAAIVVGLLRHAARAEPGPPANAWRRAAAGIERYRDATALRVLLVVCTAAFVFLARYSGFSPRVTLGGLALLGAVGPLIGLVQIAALVRVTDVPVARARLGLGVQLMALGLAAECAALLPIAGFVLGDGDRNALRDLNLGGLTGGTQLLALVATVVLLLSFRGLARAAQADAARARCDALLIAFATIVGLGLGAYYLAAHDLTPELRLHRNTALLLFMGVAFSLLAAAITILVIYLRMLRSLADAMLTRANAAAP